VGAVETSADQQEQQQQQQEPQQKKQQQKQQKQPKQAQAQQQEAPKIVPLPTSDESEQLLKIRHSVSVPGAIGAIGQRHVAFDSSWGAGVVQKMLAQDAVHA
jgi:hemolysin activation/secretion protein